jgi:hypothetical protein
VGAVTLLEPKVKVASQSVFYALRTRDGACASGCGVSQTRVAEIVFGIEIVEWDLCSVCLSRTGFLEYFNSLPSATPREAEEVKILLGISNETFERAARAPTTMVGGYEGKGLEKKGLRLQDSRSPNLKEVSRRTTFDGPYHRPRGISR